MLKPKHFELKKFLYENAIIGLTIRIEQTGVDSQREVWELLTYSGERSRRSPELLSKVAYIEPRLGTVLQLKDCYISEVEAYNDFTTTNAKELAEYNRLKAKFEESE